jgi:hypothetical protein
MITGSQQGSVLPVSNNAPANPLNTAYVPAGFLFLSHNNIAWMPVLIIQSLNFLYLGNLKKGSQFDRENSYP